MPLPARRQRFVDEYLVDLNATQAAIRAGYSPKTAQEQSSRLLSIPMVQEAVMKGRAAIAQRLAVTQEWVVERLVQNHDRAMQAEPVLDREGHPTGEYVYQGSVANKALELLGKHVGMWKDDGSGLKLPPGTEGILVWKFGDRVIPFR